MYFIGNLTHFIMKCTLSYKKPLFALWIALLGLILFSPPALAQNYCSSNPVTVHGNLSVSGTKIVDQNNNAVSFAGNSYFWSNTGWGAEKFYNANVVGWLKDNWNTTIVRAAMGVDESGGYISDATANKNRVKAVVDAAIAEGIYVIIDWHSHHAEDYQAQAISFFQEMAQTYGNSPNVIYEIYNEPLQVSWSNTIKPYAEAVISAIRAVDPDNLIIVGTPTWSQDVDVASNDPITGYSNIAYTLHFYAATHKESLRQKAQTAINNGIAIVVTEWGAVSADGGGSVDTASTDAWMSFLAANDITHANWSLTDKDEGASIIKPGSSENGGWTASDLTASGTKVKSIIQNWQQYCTGGGSGGGSNQAPTVSISSPANNSSSTAGSALTISASANDVDGSVSQVEFFANGSSLGTDTSSPYSVSWNPAAGSYSLTAVATDNSNATTTSSAIAVTVTSSGGGGGGSSSAYPNGVPHAVPGTINATNYDTGGQGVAYNDNDSGNNGDGPRSGEDVDTESRSSGGNVGWIEAGEWLEFTVDIETAGTYTITYDVASETGGGEFHLEFNGANATGNVAVATTGGWGTFTTVQSTNVQLAAGEQTMRVAFTGGSFNIGNIIFALNSGGGGGGTTNQAPAVTITGPSNNTSAAEGAVMQIAVSASDSDGTVSQIEFFANGNSLGTDTSSPYTINWAPAAGSYSLTAIATDNDSATTTSSTIAVTITEASGGGGGSSSCTFDTPRTSALPSTGNSTYNYAHVLGSGGPNMSNVSNFTINWDLNNNGLYQLSINTTNGNPSWWMDLKTYATYSLNTSNPELSFSGTGISGLDGAYWVTLDGTNLVLVSKTDGFTLYMSGSSTAPSCGNAAENSLGLETLSSNEVRIFPNPASQMLTITKTSEFSKITVFDIQGRIILQKDIIGNSAEITVANFREGMYLLKLTGNGTTMTKAFIKK